MSVPLAIAALLAAGTLRELARRDHLAELRERLGLGVPSLAVEQSGEGGASAIESDPAIAQCERYSHCHYNQAIDRMYGRCSSVGANNPVGAVCNLTTKGMEKLGDAVSYVWPF